MGTYQATGDAAVGSLDYGPYPARVLLTPGTYNPSQLTVNAVGVISSTSGGSVPTGLPIFMLFVEPIGASPFAIPAGKNVFLEASASAGADFIANLPPATGSGFIVIAKKADANAHNIVVTAAGSDLIDGLATYTITVQYAAITLVDLAARVWGIQDVKP